MHPTTPREWTVPLRFLVHGFLVLVLALWIPSATFAQLMVAGYDYWSTFDASQPRIGSSVAIGDFDGDGFQDMATGAPEADNAGTNQSGEVYLRLVPPDGSPWSQSRTSCAFDPEAGAAFGETIAFADFDQDGDDDLVVGRPHLDILAADDAGGICVIHVGGDSLIFTSTSLFTQAQLPGDGPEENDEFGSALAVGDLNGDGYRGDLWAWSP